MTAKKTIALLVAAACLCALCAACGKKTENEPPVDSVLSVDITALKTVGEAFALGEKTEEQSATYEDWFVYAFSYGGTYWRLSASIPQDVHEAIEALDIMEPDYNEKCDALVAPLEIETCEDLTAQKLTDEQMAALVGKTGQDLIDDGWVSGMGYNLDDMVFYLEYPPFAYDVVFEAKEKLVNSDDFDEMEAIKTLKVISVTFSGLGDATTLPEENAD